MLFKLCPNRSPNRSSYGQISCEKDKTEHNSAMVEVVTLRANLKMTQYTTSEMSVSLFSLYFKVSTDKF